MPAIPARRKWRQEIIFHCRVSRKPAGPPGDLVFIYKEINERQYSRDAEMILQKYEGQSLGLQIHSTARQEEALPPSMALGIFVASMAI